MIFLLLNEILFTNVELGPVLHRSQLLISEMIHFVHQTQYYIMFEATECAWDRLMEEVKSIVVF